MSAANQVFIFTLTLTLGTCQLFTLDNGNVGVNFAGFKASAGLGGLLSGDASKGGLHAEAGTPFGQSARAGLGGSVSNGGAQGGLFAGATAGSGVSAAAGLEGATSDGVSLGNAAAGASAGGLHTGVEKSSVGLGGGTVHVEKHINSHPKKYFQGEFESGVRYKEPETIKVVDRTYVKPVNPTFTVHKYYSSTPNNGGLLSRLLAGLAQPQAVNGHAAGEVHVSSPGKVAGGYTTTTRFNGGGNGGSLFNDIFNIPISTLQAVNRLVNGITGGVTVTKTAHTYK